MRDDDRRVNWLEHHQGQGVSMMQVLAELDGAISYRQLDYWLRTGRLGAIDHADGPGSRRRFLPHEVDAIKAIVTAHNVAQEMLDRITSGQAWADLMAESEVPS